MKSDKLFLNIFTEEALKKLLTEIDEVVKNLFSTKDQTDKVLEKHVSSEYLNDFKSLLAGTTDPISIQKTLTDLKAELSSREVLELQVACRLSTKSLEVIQNWLKINLGKSFVLKVNFEPQILGGAIIHYAGRFGDYSLKKRLAQDELLL